MSQHNAQSDELQAQPQPTMCSNGCGFFANAGTSGMCSKCHRATESATQALDAVTQKVAASISKPEEEQEPTEKAPVKSRPTPVVQLAAPSCSSPALSTAEGSPPPPPATSAGPCRCKVGGCKKKLGLTGFTCRCGLIFCGQHRLAESHACTFDYKTFERLKIADNNPLVQAAKIHKI